MNNFNSPDELGIGWIAAVVVVFFLLLRRFTNLIASPKLDYRPRGVEGKRN